MTTQAYEKGTALKAGKYVTIAKCPASTVSMTVNVRFVLEDMSKNAKIRYAKVPETFNDESGDAPVTGQWMQPVDIILGPNGIPVGIMEDEKVVVTAGSKLVALVDVAIVTAQVHGYARSA